VAFSIVAIVVPGISIKDPELAWAFGAAAIFVALNLLISPAVFILKILLIPLNLLTLGLMSLIVSFAFNVLIFWFMSSRGWGLHAENTLGLILGPLVLSFANALLNLLIPIRRN